MPSDFYDTERAVSEYLLFHYGTESQALPYLFGPHNSLNYPVRCVNELLILDRLPKDAVALDLGCAVGRSTFELARLCGTVVGIDFSRAFIDTANHLKRQGELDYLYLESGRYFKEAKAVVPKDIPLERVRFEQGDAMNLPPDLPKADALLMANLIDRLSRPEQCLACLKERVNPGGQLLITSPYTWLEEYTPAERWLGGYEKDGRMIETLEGIRSILNPDFELVKTKELPFLIREHARKFQWSVAQGSIWIRK